MLQMVLFFTGAFCKPCAGLKPLYNTMCTENPSAVFAVVDVNDCAQVECAVVCVYVCMFVCLYV